MISKEKRVKRRGISWSIGAGLLLVWGVSGAQEVENERWEDSERLDPEIVASELDFQRKVAVLFALRESAFLALEDGLPGLAVKDFRQFFADLEESRKQGLAEFFTLEQRAEDELALLEALVRSGAFEEALELAQEVQLPQRFVTKLYWQAQAQMGLQRWRGARDTLAKALEAMKSSEFEPELAFAGWIGLARAQVMAVVARPESEVEAQLSELFASEDVALLRQSRGFALAYFFSRGRYESVEELLSAGVEGAETNSQKGQLWRARIALARGQQAEAAAQLQALLGLGELQDAAAEQPFELPPAMRAQAVLSLAQSYRELGQFEQAQDLLLGQVASRPNNPLFAAQIFLLGEMPWLQSTEAESALEQWQQGGSYALRSAANCLLGLRAEAAQDWVLARTCFAALWNQPEGSEADQLRSFAGLKLAQLRARGGDLGAALEILDEWKASYPQQAEQLEQQSFALFLRAQASLQAGKRGEALELLEQVQGGQLELARELAWNQALVNLAQPLGGDFVQAVAQLEQEEGGQEEADSLRLAALIRAIEREEKGAILSLLGEFAEADAQSEQLALALSYGARWALEQNAQELDLPTWRGWLARARPVDSEQILELGKMRVLLALHAGETQAALQILESLLAEQAGREELSALRLQIAEAQFVRGDFAGALLQYDLFLRVAPEVEAAHLARYGAALATLQLPAQDALANAVQRLGVIVADETSPFRVEALLQQAYALQRLGEVQTAAEVLSEALTQPWTLARQAELENALSEVEFALGGEARERAFVRWKNLHQNPEVELHWRERAAWHKAQALETTGQPMEALRLYREVVLGLLEGDVEEEGQSAGNTKWFHASVRSGVSLLEAQENWNAAAALLERAVARLEDGQGEAYSEQAEAIRLRHFLQEK